MTALPIHARCGTLDGKISRFAAPYSFLHSTWSVFAARYDAVHEEAIGEIEVLGRAKPSTVDCLWQSVWCISRYFCPRCMAMLRLYRLCVCHHNLAPLSTHTNLSGCKNEICCVLRNTIDKGQLASSQLA